MLDKKIILVVTNKLLDILSKQGYIWGKIEIDFDINKKSTVIKIHQYQRDRDNDENLRRTKTIKK